MTIYSEWLKRQDVEMQNDVLGVEKARKFRDGTLTIEKFDRDCCKEYTIEELRIKHSILKV